MIDCYSSLFNGSDFPVIPSLILTVSLNSLRLGLQMVPNSYPDSAGSDEDSLPSLAKFLNGPTAHSKLTSRLSKVANVVDSDADSEELEIASRTSASGFQSLAVFLNFEALCLWFHCSDTVWLGIGKSIRPRKPSCINPQQFQ